MRDNFELSLGSFESPCSGMAQGLYDVLVIKGRILLEQNGAPCTLAEDDIALINNEDIYSLTPESANIILVLYMSSAFIESEYPRMLSCRYECNSSEQPDAELYSPSERTCFFGVKHALIRMMLAHYRHDDGCELELKQYLMELMRDIYKNFRVSDSLGKGTAVTHSSEDIRGALLYMHKNYLFGLDLEFNST